MYDGQVPAARHLHQHRPALQGRAGEGERRGGQAGGPGRAVPGEVLPRGCLHPRGRGAHRRARGGHGVRDAAGDQVLGGHRAGVPAQDEGRAGQLAAGQSHVAGVRVGRARLGQQVVPVVPTHQQTGVRQRREGGGAGAHHHPRAAQQHAQEGPVAPRRAVVGQELHHGLVGQRRGQGLAHPPHLTGRRDDDQHAAPGAQAGLGRLDQARLLGARQRGPHRPGALPGPHPAQERLPAGERGPDGELGTGGHARLAGPRGGRLLQFAGLGRGVPGRDGQAQHVGQRAGLPAGHGAGQVQDVGVEHRQGADHAAQRGQAPRVLGGGAPFDEEAAVLLPGEAHLHAHPGARHRVEVLRHQVVEEAVQVR